MCQFWLCAVLLCWQICCYLSKAVWRTGNAFEFTSNILLSQLWILFFMICWLLTEWSALFVLECTLEQPIRFFRVKEQQTIDWTLGENEIYDNFCPGGFSYSFGGNSHFFESKRSSYTMNSSGFILDVMVQLHPSCASLLLWAANYELNYKGVSLHCSSITKLHAMHFSLLFTEASI